MFGRGWAAQTRRGQGIGPLLGNPLLAGDLQCVRGHAVPWLGHGVPRDDELCVVAQGGTIAADLICFDASSALCCS